MRPITLEHDDEAALSSAAVVLLRAGWRLIDGIQPVRPNAPTLCVILAAPRGSGASEAQAAHGEARRILAHPLGGEPPGEYFTTPGGPF